MRMDVMELQNAYPELAERLFALRKELELPPTRVALSTDQDSESFLSAQATQRYEAGNDFVRLLDEIRAKEGFESFLAAPSEQEMRDAAKYGPIIVVNTSDYRCDAILIESKHVRHLALPLLEVDEIKDRVQEGNLGSPKVLAWLWDCVTEPILNALGFAAHHEGEWPHIWWIPTGPLTRFPLHAAGYHAEKSGRTVLDRTMSSYSSSVKTMIHGRRRDKSKIPRAVSDALLVAVQDTPDHVTSLPFATKEVVAVRSLCNLMGHGYTDEQDPSRSYLLLKDGRSNPLTVANLLEINLYAYSPFLAYLSACGTGQAKNDQLLDESIHLTSACQMAGFLHVIGTLWEVNDAICVDMARITYEGIKDGGMTGNSVCRGLHNAGRELRDRWLDSAAKSRHCGDPVKDRNYESSRDVLLDDDDDETETRGPLHWVPYVHFGI